MWYINLKATNEQDKQTETRGHGLQTRGYQRVERRGMGGGRQVEGGQIWGERKKSDYGR